MIGRLQPEAKVRYKAIFAVLNSLSMRKRLIKGFSRMSRPHQIE